MAEPANDWYAWQGRSSSTSIDHPTTNWIVETELELTQDMIDRDGIRASIWLAVEGPDSFREPNWAGVKDWAILQFKKESATDTAGWQAWDSKGEGAWKDVTASIKPGTYKLKMVYENGKLIQYINGNMVNEYNINTEEGLSAPTHIILQSYSFGESYSVKWKIPQVQYLN